MILCFIIITTRTGEEGRAGGEGALLTITEEGSCGFGRPVRKVHVVEICAEEGFDAGVWPEEAEAVDID